MRASSFSINTIKLFFIYKKIATALYVLQSERADLEDNKMLRHTAGEGKSMKILGRY